MPWTPKDAYRHSHKAKSPKKQRQWSHVANSMLERGKSEAAAIRAANGVIAKHAAGGMVRIKPPVLGAPPPVIGHQRSPLGQSPLGIAIQNRGNAGRYAGGMGLAPARPPRVPIGGMLRNIDQGLMRNKPRLKALGGSLRASPQPDQGAMDPRVLQVIMEALKHLKGMDASSASAVLRSSPEAMAHPHVAAAAQALRSSHGITPATKTLQMLSQAGSASSGPQLQKLSLPPRSPAGAPGSGGPPPPVS